VIGVALDGEVLSARTIVDCTLTLLCLFDCGLYPHLIVLVQLQCLRVVPHRACRSVIRRTLRDHACCMRIAKLTRVLPNITHEIAMKMCTCQ
jgi:hypothetical protein